MRLMSGGEGDPQNERFEALAGGGGGAVSGSRDWLNDKLFDDDDRQRMERPTNKMLRSLYFFYLRSMSDDEKFPPIVRK